jgi:hypothetical protein
VFEAAGDFVEGVHFYDTDHRAGDAKILRHFASGVDLAQRGLQWRNETGTVAQDILFVTGTITNGAAGRRLAPGMVRVAG